MRSRLALLLTLILALLVPVSADGMRRARKGQLVALDKETFSTLRTFRGESRGDGFGTTLSMDVVPVKDAGAMVIGAPGADGGAGQLRVVDQDTRQTFLTVDAADLGDDVARLGESLANLGHVDSSAVHWLVGAPGAPPEAEDVEAGPTRDAGRATLPAAFVLEPVGDELLPRIRLDGEPDSLFGWRVATFDETDVDDSRLSFFAVSAPLEDRNARKVAAGAVYAYDTHTGERLWVSRGRRKGEHFGYALASTGAVVCCAGFGASGDVDGDGITDLWVGAPGAREGKPRGRVYLLSGRNGRLLARFNAPPEAGQFGFALRVMDLDGDGELELLVGAPASDPDGLEDAGSVYVFDDARKRRAPTRLDGLAEDEWFGVRLSNSPDLDDDGTREVIVSSLDRHRRARRDRRGRVSLVSPATGERLHELVGKRGGDHFGVSLFHPFFDFDDNGVTDYIASITREPILFIPG